MLKVTMRMKTVKVWFIVGLFGVVVQALNLSAQAVSFSLHWNPSSEPNVVQYKVYVGTSSHQYEHAYDVVGNSTLISDLPPGLTYYFAVTAVNNAGLESSFSEEVSSAGGTGTTLNSTISSSSLRLTVNVDPGSSVVFESSNNLVNWQLHSTVNANSQGTATLNQPRSTLGSLRFFRVRIP
jgi:fibronectin type 3 domain-containing protein